jgi:predicted molibdopterin-dependent oxidoreductase YjgC
MVELHEIDAARLAVKDGDAVRVTSRRGTAAAARGSLAEARPGVVFIPIHFAEAAANLLTIDTLDPKAKIPEFKASAVDIQIASKQEAQQLPPLPLRGRY